MEVGLIILAFCAKNGFLVAMHHTDEMLRNFVSVNQKPHFVKRKKNLVVDILPYLIYHTLTHQ